MKQLLLPFFFLVCLHASAQQWVDKVYTYDSTMNVIYGTALNFNNETDTLKMDIYLPVCDDPQHESTRPLLLWVHGGAFLAGSKEDASITNLCKQFAKRGYVTASINYRLGFVSDDAAWSCNYPNYSCVFASDSAEWLRALYRGVQDGKGALRYLINRHNALRIDTTNVFVAGESAGAIAALGIALLDTAVERMPQTYQLADVPLPNASASGCVYNQGHTFSGNGIPRPDLGGINGTIEPTTINYTIKGVGNMYGAMASNLLKYNSANKPKPAIFSFHQPCDLVVPIDSARIMAGISWCLTNGYNCYAVANTPKIYGSRAFSDWNISNNYGYTIHNEFTNVNFPYSFLFGQGSCADQTNNPCHAYDNAALRENNLATFFAGLVTTSPICDANLSTETIELDLSSSILVYPNPANEKITITCNLKESYDIVMSDCYGKIIYTKNVIAMPQIEIDMTKFAKGIYFLSATPKSGKLENKIIVKQ